MTKITFARPVEKISGKVNKESNISFRGNHSYSWNPDNVIRATPARVLQRYAMLQATLQVKEMLASDTVPVAWRAAFESNQRSQKPATHIRFFLVGLRLREIKSAVLSGDESVLRPLIDLAQSRGRQQDATLLATYLPHA